GEYRNGQWWGGLYGWYGRYGLMMIFAAMDVATECAYLLSGDKKYLELLRSQIDQLLLRSKTTQEGQLLVPYRINKDGWHSYRPVMIRDLAHLWHASMDTADWARIDKVHAGHKFRPLNGDGIWGKNTLDHLDKATPYKPTAAFDWSEEMVLGDRTMGKSEYARLMYYAGENPDWPLEALKADFQEMNRRMEFMRQDKRPISEIKGDDTYPNNPIIIKALQQTTMGTPQTIYFGGLLRATVRYFDAVAKRPGLPKEVSALVTALSSEGAIIQLVNLNPVKQRQLIIQAGAFGEHQFTDVSFEVTDPSNSTNAKSNEKSIAVQGTYIRINLDPSSAIRLKLGMDRFVDKPSYRFPWDD
ncbi:MAG: hypothetical protein HKN76_07170, partial [Saprospiraceae bacterium]|nr:hypothetical protein [Saprospiraceae bacterium]